MIVEVRTYRIKAGRRDEFIRFFDTRTAPAQRALGMKLLGPLLDVENPDVFVFLRGFPSLDERDAMKNAFYEGAEWKEELEAIAMPMIDSYTVVVTEVPARFINDLA
ncbi:MAG: NIPSNAP family protein [Thermoanaerobaculia bacterium]